MTTPQSALRAASPPDKGGRDKVMCTLFPNNKKSHSGNAVVASFLVSQASAALSSSASQHLAAVGGSHSLAETVLHLAMTLLGLISTEHSVLPLSICEWCCEP